MDDSKKDDMEKMTNIEQTPSAFDWLTIGDKFAEEKQWGRALYCYNRITVPGSLPHTKRIAALVNIGTPDAMMSAGDLAWKLYIDYPLDANAVWARGSVFMAACKFEVASDLFLQAHMMDNSESRHGCDAALALQQCGRFEEAKRMFEQVIALHPLKIEVRTWYGMLLMLMGDLTNGWREYESRVFHDTPVPVNGKPVWNGEPLAGKTIAVFQEQGVGDTVQFIQFARWLKGKGAKVIVVVRDNMYRLALACDGVDAVYTNSTVLPDYDYHIRMMSLGRLAHEAGFYPVAGLHLGPYLKVAPIQRGAAFRVGLCWQGGKMHAQDKFRSMPFETFAPILSNPGLFVNLCDDKRDRLQPCDPTDVYSLAQFVQSCDLVVTVDTAVAHIAGALGVKCFVMLPFAPDWRWGLTTPATPWYSSVSLYRCKRPLEWGPVIEIVKGDVKRCSASTACQQT